MLLTSLLGIQMTDSQAFLICAGFIGLVFLVFVAFDYIGNYVR